jgi:hypothetical protein
MPHRTLSLALLAMPLVAAGGQQPTTPPPTRTDSIASATPTPKPLPSLAQAFRVAQANDTAISSIRQSLDEEKKRPAVTSAAELRALTTRIELAQVRAVRSAGQVVNAYAEGATARRALLSQLKVGLNFAALSSPHVSKEFTSDYEKSAGYWRDGLQLLALAASFVPKDAKARLGIAAGGVSAATVISMFRHASPRGADAAQKVDRIVGLLSFNQSVHADIAKLEAAIDLALQDTTTSAEINRFIRTRENDDLLLKEGADMVKDRRFDTFIDSVLILTTKLQPQFDAVTRLYEQTHALTVAHEKSPYLTDAAGANDPYVRDVKTAIATLKANLVSARRDWDALTAFVTIPPLMQQRLSQFAQLQNLKQYAIGP